MNLIITMAGKYSRFVNEGYKFPKYLLPWGAKTIVYEILDSLTKENIFDNVYLVANKNDDQYMPHLRKIMEGLGLPKSNLLLIDDTTGQAQTAYISIQEILKSKKKLLGPILFHNIDTILIDRDISIIKKIFKESDLDGYIDIFESNNHEYSYIVPVNGLVGEIEEKIVVSNMATSGLYGFKNYNVFLDNFSHNCAYISDIYKAMIKNGLKIGFSKLHNPKSVIVLGTPKEYIQNSYLLDFIP